ncbi:PEP-CTERM/exosortase system-associated acyltransferase [Pseudomaricurvus alkylphenolicus]|jgi:N-acyl amino acid synthase of PEP-CTERM/exosortase system|uniref:PEP-CTERM/exosortase system-associated acyltransferase n=1 Tax=Pseudomaricurvus alkylphenolicus TaxID=1306991 RepID=UPI00142260F5|nr:PEP-CTERM/exosortase system-associated acyltransferase [Pseudomaricurvus alkylphenolicus]NIB43155.1 PEP-CTERM/exosortase system-associated acyltransferase [Pseudomaricurvus alkylphenolicus]
MTTQSIAENYIKYFDITIAQSEEELKEVYGIRYRVYAEEFGFERPEEFPDKIERDEFDDGSVHSLITHKPTGKPAGCVRMVPTRDTKDKDPLPLEKYCDHCLDHDYLRSLEMPRQTMCEISRLAVDGEFRKRPGESMSRVGAVDDASEEEYRTFPLIAVSAFLAAIAMSNAAGRGNMLMMTEPFLPKLMSRSGIIVERAGQDMDYHGIRAPYYLCGERAAQGIKSNIQDLYSHIYNTFENHPLLKA